MLLEKIIEFQLRGILQQAGGNVAGGNVHNFPLHGPNHLQLKFYTIKQDFERGLDFKCL